MKDNKSIIVVGFVILLSGLFLLAYINKPCYVQRYADDFIENGKNIKNFWLVNGCRIERETEYIIQYRCTKTNEDMKTFLVTKKEGSIFDAIMTKTNLTLLDMYMGNWVGR